MTVDDYIDSLPEDRRIALRSVREVINSRIPPGYEEGIVYGMISWFVPFTRLAETYNGQPLCIASLGAQSGHMALHLMSVYGDPKLRAWFEKAYKQSGKRLDMGKACVRFKTLDALPLGVIGDAIAKVPVDRYVEAYAASRGQTAKRKAATKTAATRTTAKAAKKSAKPAKKIAKPAKKSAKPAKKSAKPAKKSAKPAKKSAK